MASEWELGVGRWEDAWQWRVSCWGDTDACKGGYWDMRIADFGVCGFCCLEGLVYRLWGRLCFLRVWFS